jgi:hypothetical protein
MSREIARSALETTGRVQQPLGAHRSMRDAVNQAIRLTSRRFTSGAPASACDPSLPHGARRLCGSAG